MSHATVVGGDNRGEICGRETDGVDLRTGGFSPISRPRERFERQRTVAYLESSRRRISAWQPKTSPKASGGSYAPVWQEILAQA